MTTLFGSLMLDIHGTWLTAEDRRILRQPEVGQEVALDTLRKIVARVKEDSPVAPIIDY